MLSKLDEAEKSTFTGGDGWGWGGWLDLLKLRLAKPVSRALAGAGLRKINENAAVYKLIINMW